MPFDSSGTISIIEIKRLLKVHGCSMKYLVLLHTFYRNVKNASKAIAQENASEPVI